MKKIVQHFNESLPKSKPTPDQVAQFLEDFRLLHEQMHLPSKSVLISIRIDERLLKLFRFKAEAEGKKYQTKIKELMLAYLKH